VPGKNGYVGSATTWTGASTELGWYFDPELDSVDDLTPFPQSKLTRNLVYSWWWLGKLANGTYIAPGKYK
jgi:hypothetical protein